MFDALAWLKSVFNHGPALVHADLATEQWNDLPLPRSPASWRQPASANDDGEWDAVIARAKMRAAPPSPLRLLPRPSLAVSPPAEDDWDAAIRRAKAERPIRLSPRLLTRR